MARIIFLIAFCIMLAAANVYAATHAVRPSTATDAVNGCANNGDGSTWGCASSPGGVGAMTTLPAASAWVRGDTYYFADGRYASVTIATATSGISVITLQKATTTAHGTSTGWQNSYGDGQAVFAQPVYIRASYVIFDGVVGSLSSNPDDYGFRIATPTGCDTPNHPAYIMLGMPGVGYSGVVYSNISVSHIAMSNCGGDYMTYGNQEGAYSYAASGSSNISITHNFFSDSASNVAIHRWSNVDISYNYFNRNWSNAVYEHGQQISTDGCANVTISNNIFKDSQTYALGLHANIGSNTGVNVFNNIITGQTGEQLSGCLAAISGLPNTILQGRFHHNTFVNVNCGGYGAVFVGNISDVASNRSYAYNNLFYNTINPNMSNSGYTSGAIVHSHNAHYNSTGTYDSSEGGTAQVGTGDPFVNSSGGNYHLAAHTDAGTTLSSPFNVDLDGVTRSYFDRGAYEYVSGTVTPPAAPTGLTVR